MKQVTLIELEIGLLSEPVKIECEKILLKIEQEQERYAELYETFRKDFASHQSSVRQACMNDDIEHLELLDTDNFSACLENLDVLNQFLNRIDFHIHQIKQKIHRKVALMALYKERLRSITDRVTNIDNVKDYMTKLVNLLESEIIVLDEPTKTKCDDIFNQIVEEQLKFDNLYLELRNNLYSYHNAVMNAYQNDNIEQIKSHVIDDFSICRQNLDDLERVYNQIEIYVTKIDLIKIGRRRIRLLHIHDVSSKNNLLDIYEKL